MRRSTHLLLALGLILGLLPVATALAHPDEQHGEDEGHLSARQENVEVVGHLDLFADEEKPGRVSDVAAFGDYAYLGAFYKPDCRDGGVYVIDISDPSAPREAGFIPTSPGSHVGEGVQVLDMDTAHFTGQVLIHNNENCALVDGALPAGLGGVSIWDVSDPESPEPLVRHFGDVTRTDPTALWLGMPNPIHSAFGWQHGDNAYVALVDDTEDEDLDILDITDPRHPVLISETGLPDFPEAKQEDPPNGDTGFLHDLMVKEIGTKQIMLASYWDAGYVILDVTDPAAPVYLRDTDYAGTEPYHEQIGQEKGFRPEGNAHQAEFSHDNAFFIATDEDFNSRRIQGTIDGGIYGGDTFAATQGSDVPHIDEETTITGSTKFVGNGCAPMLDAPESTTALIERGGCTFDVKVVNAQNAGYQAGIVFNDKSGCEDLVNMGANGDIPFLFVKRSVGLKILNIEDFTDPCATETIGESDAQPVTVAAVFDGWGYVHLFDTDTMDDIDQYAIPESLDPTYAAEYGALSVHEVATHPSENRAYISYYSGGFRVIEFDEDGIREVGVFIDEGGNDFWGVEVHTLPGADEHIVLASDRDSGLYILRYVEPKVKECGARRGADDRGRRDCEPPGRPAHAGTGSGPARATISDAPSVADVEAPDLTSVGSSTGAVGRRLP